MNCRLFTAAWTFGLLATASVVAQAQNPVLAQSGVPQSQGVNLEALDASATDSYGEELLRGPVHEAFAEQYSQDPIDGVVIDREPPPPVNEIPPEVRPEGDNVEWLSGYWFWDDDRSDFLWISGTWRVIPPGQRWLPGYWAESDDQYQWVSGSWVSTQQEAIQYIAQSPPESLDNGPVGVAPSENHFWIPGCWTWTQNDYAWRPGYWSGGHSNWVWVPQRYLWTPRGYVFCNGYWDYPIARRGTLFAPFYFNQPVYSRSNFFFTPRVSILASLLQSHFWVRPRYHHYYFGDFYASNYRNAGIIPWHSYHRGVGFQSRRYSFDPLFVHANLYNRSGGGNFYQQINNQYNLFVNQSDRRPSHTYRDQQQRGDRGRGFDGRSDDRFNRGTGNTDRNESLLGESIRDLAQRNPDRFTRLTTEQLQRVRNESRGVPELASLRRDNERSSRDRDSAGRDRQAFGLDRPSPNRPGAERNGDQPADQRRNEPGRDGDRDVGRGVDSIVDRLQLPPLDRDRTDRGRGNRDGQTAQSPSSSTSEGRYSSSRPQIDSPTTDRPAGDRPAVDRPAGDRPSIGRPSGDLPRIGQPSVDRPSVGRPSTERPSTERPGRGAGNNDAPTTGNRISDSIRDRLESRTPLPGAGTPAAGPQIGAPSTQPLRTPGYSGPSRPSFNRGEGTGQRESGRPSLMPNLQPPTTQRPNVQPPTMQRPNVQQPSVPSTRLPGLGRPSQIERPGPSNTPTLRAPFSGGSTPSLRSGLPSPSSRPQFAPQTDRGAGRQQFTPQIRGGSRPEGAPSLRGGGGRPSGDGGGRGPRSRGNRD